MRLNGAIGNIFKDWLYKAFPDRADKVWHQICECHDGQVSDSRWGNRITGDGKYAELIRDQFKLYCRKYNFNEDKSELNTTLFRRLKNKQLSLF